MLRGVSKSFEGRAALTDVDLDVPEGATHALIGTSGSGKTTLLRMTLGLIPPDRGEIRIEGRPLSSGRAEWAERIGYVPQEGGLFPHLTAGRNVALVAALRGWSAVRVQRRLSELCALVDLDSALLARFPHALSGGQNQRVSIMRAAFLNPKLFLLDEPMGALDPLIRRSLQQELKTIFKRLGKTVVLVTHDLGEAAFLAEKLTILHEGRVVQTGGYAELALHPALPFVSEFIRAYRTLPEAEDLKWIS